jgi:hypothetical protein
MKKILLSVALLALGSSYAAARPEFCVEDKSFFGQPAVMLGVTFNFGGGSTEQNFGISAKILSNDWQDYQAAAVGVTYFPMKADHKLGLDASLAYKGTFAAGTLGWDFLNQQPQVSAGYVDAQEPRLSYCRFPI